MQNLTNSGDEELVHALGGGLSFLAAILIFALAAAFLFYKKYQVFQLFSSIRNTGIPAFFFYKKYQVFRVRNMKHELTQLSRTQPHFWACSLPT